MHFFFFLLYLTRGMRLGESFRMSDTSECSLVVVAVFFFFSLSKARKSQVKTDVLICRQFYIYMSFFVPLLHSLDCVFFFFCISVRFWCFLLFLFTSSCLTCCVSLFFFLCVCVFVGLSFPSFLFFFLLSMHVSSTLVVTVQAVVDDGLFFSLCTHQRVLFCTVSHTHTHMQDFFFSSLLYSLGFSFWLGD